MLKTVDIKEKMHHGKLSNKKGSGMYDVLPRSRMDNNYFRYNSPKANSVAYFSIKNVKKKVKSFHNSGSVWRKIAQTMLSTLIWMVQ